jgi:cell division protein FtsL
MRKMKQVPMTEFRTVKRIDNSRLVRHVEPVKLKNFYKTAALGSAIALCCMLYVFQHFKCIDLSFQLEELKQKQAVATALNSGLKLNIATLSRPGRIDQIARQRLGLTDPRWEQVREYDAPSGAQMASIRYTRANRVQ